VMEAMPRPRPPYLSHELTRHGRDVWYVRRNGRRIRLRSKYGTPEFEGEYRAALTGMPLRDDGPQERTLAWLIERYRETTAWAVLSYATRRQRENIFRHVIESAGKQPFARITEDTIRVGRERRASTPAQARNFLDAMRGLFHWALEAKHVRIDPTLGVKNPPRKKGPGFRMWTEDDMMAYERRWPLGTRQRVWLDVLAYTGLRRGDAVRLGKQHVRNGVASLKTEKSGFTVTVTLPVLPVLAATLAAGPIGDLTFVVGANGKPMSKEYFGNALREACDAAGVPGSAHGVRKIAAARAAQNGATVAQLKALFGWTSDAMAGLYTREADRVRLAREAVHTLQNDPATSIVAPLHEVRQLSEKDQ